MLNLTQHKATPEQIASGVSDLQGGNSLEALIKLLTVPAQELLAPDAGARLVGRANGIAFVADSVLARQYGPRQGGQPREEKIFSVMIGGLPALMAPLERALEEKGIQVFYAVSDRVSQDVPQEDGTCKKVSVFKHLGFVRAVPSYQMETPWHDQGTSCYNEGPCDQGCVWSPVRG